MRSLFAFFRKREPDPVADALKAAIENPQNAPAFFRALLNTPLHALQRGGDLLQFADTSGGPFIPIFTRASLLPRAPEGFVAIEKPGRELLEMARDQVTVVLNAGQKEFKAFAPADLTRILDHLVKSRFEV